MKLEKTISTYGLHHEIMHWAIDMLVSYVMICHGFKMTSYSHEIKHVYH